MENYNSISVQSLIKAIIPTLSYCQVKGDNGTIGVIGGSLEYTGAPYYSGISALKAGSDLAHIFSHIEAAIPIKSYSPELIVHPSFDQNPSNDTLLNKTIRWFKSMHAIAMGPGLGRTDEIGSIFRLFSNKVNELKIPLIYDADALWYLSSIEGITNNLYRIITPNKPEFEKLYQKYVDAKAEFSIENKLHSLVDNESVIIRFDNNYNHYFDKEFELCKALDNNILVKKGPSDIITNGKIVYIVQNKGSMKRTGGIGDVLTGLITSYCGMVYKKNQINKTQCTQEEMMECCVLGCYICREASRLAFEEYKYGMTAPDIISQLINVTKNYNMI